MAVNGDVIAQCDLVMTAGDKERGPQKELRLQPNTAPQQSDREAYLTESHRKRGCFSCCGSRMTRQQCLVFWLCGAVNFGASASVATMAPFFPQEAERRGMSASNAALVFSIYAISALLTSPFMTKLLPYIGSKNVFLAGSVLVGTGNIAFGSLAYVEDLSLFSTYCFIIRVLMGTGSAANITATYTYVSGLFPERIAATLGLLEVFTALGTCTGPALGGLLFALGGYSIPFYSVGGFLLLLLPINICAMPSIPAKSRRSGSYCALLAYFPVYIVLGVVAMVTIIFGFTEATMAPHLHKRFGMDAQDIGLIFLLFAVVYGLASPLVGCLSDVIRHRTPLIGSALALVSIACVVFSPPQLLNFIPSDQLWLPLVCLCLAAASLATAMVPTFGVLLQMAKGPAGMPDDVSTDALVSSAFQTFFYVGYVVGPSLGGFLMDNMGFSNSLGIISLGIFFWGVLTLITGTVLACRGTDQVYHSQLPTEDLPEASAPRPSISSEPLPEPPSPSLHRSNARPPRLDLSRHSAPPARDSGGYRSYHIEVGSLSPPPERSVHLGDAPGAPPSQPPHAPGSRTSLAHTDRSGSRSGLAGSRLGSRFGPGGSHSGSHSGSRAGSRSGSRSGLEKVAKSTQELEEERIADMIKNADLSELQELLKSPMDAPPADLPWL